MNSTLSARWHQLTAPLLANEFSREATLVHLTAAYEAPNRHYHTLQHVENLLDAVQPEAATLHDAEAVQLAVWFHDAVYNPLRNDNEARSAALALKFLAESPWPLARQQRVAFLIECTQDHTLPQPDDDTDLHLFLDADLGVLGTTESYYWQYARQVRQEYHLVPDFLYRRGRCKVLAKLLSTATLYRTEPYRTRLEAAARHNLHAELLVWERGGDLTSC